MGAVAAQTLFTPEEYIIVPREASPPGLDSFTKCLWHSSKCCCNSARDMIDYSKVDAAIGGKTCIVEA